MLSKVNKLLFVVAGVMPDGVAGTEPLWAQAVRRPCLHYPGAAWLRQEIQDFVQKYRDNPERPASGCERWAGSA